MATQAVIYYTHFVSDVVSKELKDLRAELGPEFNIFAVGCCPAKTTLDPLVGNSIDTRAYIRDELRALPYTRQLQGVDWETMRRSSDLAIMQFFQGNPNFDYYWIVEYDVRFTGSWRELFAVLNESSADLLCTFLTKFEQGRDWMHWKSFSTPDDSVKEDDLYRAFLPFCRLSKTLMQAIDERCREGWTGHPEVLWPTVAHAVGGNIEDIGGSGPSTPDSRRDKYYFSALPTAGLFLSTFGAWPAYSEKSAFRQISLPDILWHPVKE